MCSAEMGDGQRTPEGRFACSRKSQDTQFKRDCGNTCGVRGIFFSKKIFMLMVDFGEAGVRDA